MYIYIYVCRNLLQFAVVRFGELDQRIDYLYIYIHICVCVNFCGKGHAQVHFLLNEFAWAYSCDHILGGIIWNNSFEPNDKAH